MKRATLYSTAVAALLLLPGLFVGPSFDAAVFTETAARLRDGVVPYTGVWDHKPPGIYLLGATAQLVLPWPNPWVVMWIVGLACVAGGAVLVALTLHRLGFRGGAVFGGMVAGAVPSMFIISLGGGLTEPMTTLPLAAALLVVLSDADPNRWRARNLLAGALLGVALLISLIAVAGVAAIGVLALVRNTSGNRPQRALLLAAGAGVPWVAVFIPLAVAGGFPAAIDALVTYGAAYRAVNLSHLREYANAEAAVVVLSLVVVAVPALVGLLRAVRLPDPWPLVALAGAVWTLATVAIAVYLGRFETHYAATLGIPIALLASVGVVDVLRRMRRRRSVGLIMIPATAGAAALSLAVIAANSWALVGPLQAETDRTDAVAAYLREHAPPGTSLFVWGNEPQLYYLSHRTPASRFIYMLPLTTPGYATPALVDSVRAELAARAPSLIVDAGSLEPGTPGDPSLLIPRPVVNEDGRAYDILDPLRSYIAQNYALLDVVDGWPVYQRQGGG